MSKVPKIAFSISPTRPEIPTDVSNRPKPPVRPLTVHVGGRKVEKRVPKSTEEASNKPSPKSAEKTINKAATKSVSKASKKPKAKLVKKPGPVKGPIKGKSAPKDPIAEKKRAAAMAIRQRAVQAAELARAEVEAAAKTTAKTTAKRAEITRDTDSFDPEEPVVAPRISAAAQGGVAGVSAEAVQDALSETLLHHGARDDAPAATETKVKSTETPPDARAMLLAQFAASFGVTAGVKDLEESLLREGDLLTPEAVSASLQQAGLNAQSHVVASIKAKTWPALAFMSSGHVVWVMAQNGDVLTIYDATAPDQRAEVTLHDFVPYFTGAVVKARKTLSQLSMEHAPDIARQHWFWSQFADYKKQIGEIALGSLIANMLAVAVALFSLQVYDRVIPHQSQATLWVLAIGVSLAICLEGVLKLARARLMDGSGRLLEMKTQSMLMDKLLGMRSDARPTSPSGLFSAMREFGSVREFFTSSTIGTLADIPFIFLFLALVASIAGPVVLLLIVGATLMLVPGFFFQKRMMKLTKETQGASAKASRLLHEAVSELDTIKTQRGEERVRRLWDELNLLSAVKSSQQRKLSGILTYWAQGVQQLTYVSAVVAGAYMVFAGEFTVGTIIATGILTSRTLAPLTQLSGTMARWSNVKTALEGLDAIANAPQDKGEDRNFLRREKIDGNFTLRETQFRYEEEGAPTIDIPAVDIKQGQTIALLGANGSGKSTFIKLLAGLYSPSQGRLMLDGAEMSQIDPRDVRRNVGYLGQDVRLFAGTLRENLNLGGMERDTNRLFEALDFSGLGDFVRGHHRGLDLEIRDGGEGLSVGQRQSIGWARLWLQDPQICLLDEPTAALDQALETGIIQRLKGWLAGRTTVIATHRMPIVALSNRVMVFSGGRMVVDGPRDDVMAHIASANAKKSGAKPEGQGAV